MGKLIVKFMSFYETAQIRNENNAFITVQMLAPQYDELIDDQGDLWPRVNLWMQEECEGTVVVPWSKYVIFFELESDAMAFKLKWL